MSKVDASEKPDPNASVEEDLTRERDELLQRLEDWLETPMLVLAFVWLALLVVELIWGESLLFGTIGTIIWVVFILDFAVKLALAPHKVAFLKRDWLTAISLLLPALRIFRVFRVFRLLRLARAGRGLRLLRVVSSLNRSMKALSASLSRRASATSSLSRCWSRSPARPGYSLSRTGAWRPKQLRRCAVVDRHDHDDVGFAVLAANSGGARAVRLAGAVRLRRLRLRDSGARHLLRRPRRGE
jgi:hypothetical protein